MTATDPAPTLPEQYTTRPGTPMIGPYSANQMDDFYEALHRGEAKPTGIMNLLQHLLIAEHCPEGATVLDVCCGRGLALPLLHRYAPQIFRYIGLDISPENISEAHKMLERCRAVYGEQFGVEFVHCDVSEPFAVPQVDLAIYTSALEHLPGPLGEQVDSGADALALAQQILRQAVLFRPPPDYTILLLGERDTCLDRFEQRLNITLTLRDRQLVGRIEELYRALAEIEPDRYIPLTVTGMTANQCAHRLAALCRSLIDADAGADYGT